MVKSGERINDYRRAVDITKNIMSFTFGKRFCKKIVEMTNKKWQKVYRKAVKSIVGDKGASIWEIVAKGCKRTKRV